MTKRPFKFRAVRRSRLAFPTLAATYGAIQTSQSGHRQAANAQSTNDRGALFIAPDGAGSLGDGAMIQAGIAHLQGQGFSQFGVVYPQYSDNTPDFSYIPHITENIGIRYKPEDYLDQWQQSLKNYWQDLMRFRQVAQNYGRVYCIGADVMDGYYSLEICEFLTDLMMLAGRAGVNTTLVGFSFNKQPAPRAVQVLKNLPKSVRLCSRDPLSRERAEAALGRTVEQVADAAFLLKPTASKPPIEALADWIEAQRQEGRILFGINTNAMLLRAVEGLTVEAFTNHYAQTLEQLFRDEPNLSLVMLPHDDRYEVNDVVLTELLLKQLPEPIRSRCAQLQLPCGPGDVKKIAGALDMVMTSRMHVAIASLGQGTPTLSITYQDKHEGLYQHFDLPQLLISPEKALEPQGLVDFIQTYLPQREVLRQQVEAKLPGVMNLARANFA